MNKNELAKYLLLFKRRPELANLIAVIESDKKNQAAFSTVLEKVLSEKIVITEGKQGEPGKDGYTPVLGKDFFTAEDIKKIVSECTPTVGKDYFTKEQIDVFVNAIKEIFSENFVSIEKKIEKNQKDVYKEIGKINKKIDDAPSKDSILVSVLEKIPKPIDINQEFAKDIAKLLNKLQNEERISFKSLRDIPTNFGSKETRIVKGGGVNVFSNNLSVGAAGTLNFTGSGVTVTQSGSTITINIAAGSIAIGEPVTNGTPKSSLFINASGNLAQDNANYIWNYDAESYAGAGDVAPRLELGGFTAPTNTSMGVDVPSFTFGTNGSARVGGYLSVGYEQPASLAPNFMADFTANINDYAIVTISNKFAGSDSSSSVVFNNSLTTVNDHYAELGLNDVSYDSDTFAWYTANMPDRMFMHNTSEGITFTAFSSGIANDVAYSNSINATNISVASNTLAVSSNKRLWTGMRVILTLSGGTITGLTSGTEYFIIRNSATSISLATTQINAFAGTAIDITAQSGAGTYTLTIRESFFTWGSADVTDRWTYDLVNMQIEQNGNLYLRNRVPLPGGGATGGGGFSIGQGTRATASNAIVIGKDTIGNIQNTLNVKYQNVGLQIDGIRTSFTIASTAVNTTNDQINVGSTSGLTTGMLVRFTTSGTVPTVASGFFNAHPGVSGSTQNVVGGSYYVIVVDSSNIRLTNTYDNALSGSIYYDFTSQGTGNHTITVVPVSSFNPPEVSYGNITKHGGSTSVTPSFVIDSSTGFTQIGNGFNAIDRNTTALNYHLKLIGNTATIGFEGQGSPDYNSQITSRFSNTNPFSIFVRGSEVIGRGDMAGFSSAPFFFNGSNVGLVLATGNLLFSNTTPRLLIQTDGRILAGGQTNISNLVSNRTFDIRPIASNFSGLAIRGLSSQTANLFEIENSSLSQLFVVSSQGNVGIGTTNPGQSLSVLGTASTTNPFASFTRNIVDNTNVQPIQRWGFNHVGGVAFGSVAQWEFDRTATGTDPFAGRLNLRMYSDRGSGTYTLQSTPLQIEENGRVTINGFLRGLKADVIPYTVANGASPNTAATAFMMTRPLAGGIKFATNASFQIHTYDTTNINARTQLSLWLSNGATANEVVDTQVMTWNANGNVGIGTSTPSALLDINSDTLRLRTARTPASATATGNQGDIAWDSSYFYVCTATNTWRRVAHATW